MPESNDTTPVGHRAGGADLEGRTMAHYRLIRELGRGGQGAVWLAEDTRSGDTVALKLLAWHGPDSESAVARYRREADVVSRLRHPAICAFFEAGEANGLPYIAMEHVCGETLAQKINGRRQQVEGGESTMVVLGDESEVTSEGASGRTTQSLDWPDTIAGNGATRNVTDRQRSSTWPLRCSSAA